MTNTDTNFKVFLLNVFDYLCFGFDLIRKGICDNRIKGTYFLNETCKNLGYTKTEAANLLKLSVRQFDRRVKQGFLPKGRKYQGFKSLYWDKEYIDNMSHKVKR